MTLFEYMSVAISLIVALTFAEALRGMRSALNPQRRYGPHLAWLLIKLSNPINFWWRLWVLRDFPHYWNWGTYLLALIIPGLIYMQVMSLLGDNPNTVSDWRKHFYEQMRWFFGLNALSSTAAVILLLTTYMNTSVQADPFSLIGYTLIGSLSIAACFTENPKFHSAFSYCVLLFNILYLAIRTYSPAIL